MPAHGDRHRPGGSLLLQDGSRQADLWGVNLYPELPPAELVEFDSMINARPLQHNRSRGLEDAAVRRRLHEIVERLAIR